VVEEAEVAVVEAGRTGWNDPPRAELAVAGAVAVEAGEVVAVAVVPHRPQSPSRPRSCALSGAVRAAAAAAAAVVVEVVGEVAGCSHDAQAAVPHSRRRGHTP
jgi:hypothetical protein